MTIGELINKARLDEQSKVDAAEALRLATTALNEAMAADQASDQALADGLAVTGPVFVVEPDGTASIYAAGGTGSYNVTVAKPVDTTVS